MAEFTDQNRPRDNEDRIHLSREILGLYPQPRLLCILK